MNLETVYLGHNRATTNASQFSLTPHTVFFKRDPSPDLIPNDGNWGHFMWVYETKEFKDLAGRFGLSDSVARINERIESARGRVEVSQRVESRFPWYLKKEGTYRLIGGIKEIRGQEVFVWYRLLKRGDPGYTPFRKLADDYFAITQDFNQGEFELWFRDQQRSLRKNEQVDPLPTSFYPWFERVHQAISSITDSSSDVFLESHDWVNRITWEGRDDLRAYYRIIATIADSKKDDKQLLQLCFQNDEAKGSDAAVTYTRIDQTTWFLIAPTRTSELEGSDSVPFPDRDTALRSAARAYPSWVLSDVQLWSDIQKEAEANLSLSIEERQILESVAGVGLADHRLPLFINGQAGSGKSTMLAYVFAGLLKKMLDDELPGNPIFITHSERLIDSARKATRRLLATGFDSNEKYKNYDLDHLFLTWQEFLLNLLPDDLRQDFSPERHVSFRDFKSAFEGRRGTLKPLMTGAGRFSAETVWFVIRSLIKGHENSLVFGPDDYESEISERDRIVSTDDFSEIFENYYMWYQRQLDEYQLWDDQDLVNEILKLENHQVDNDRIISALVVDEAQDFTRCELRLLTRNLVFAQYGAPSLPNIRVPIVLAGDPLQTLSPTGFKWDTIRAGLTSELRSMLGEKAHVPDFQPLQNNYRSKPGVVGFANLVQAWRSWMFGLDIRAQGAWSPQNAYAYLPRKFTLDDGSRSVDDFTRLLTDTMTVIPVDEGGEIDFVKNDPILSAIYPDASETSRPFTVLSATAVKGLEFSKVVLYKFGDCDLPKINWEKSDNETRDLSAEYFFNKLYVGITRATQDLYVVDTVKGTENLWSHFSPQEAEKLEGALPHFLQPLDDLGIPGQMHGIEESIEGLEGLEEQNPLENALKLKSFGIDSRDAKQLRRAEYFFRRTGDVANQRLCNAFALRFEDQFIEAAQEFLAIDRAKEAWECAWISSSWTLMVDIFRAHPNVAGTEIKSAVLFMTIATPTAEDSLNALSAVGTIYENKVAPGTADPAWRSLINQILSSVDTSSTSEHDRTMIADRLDLLGKQGFREAALKAGDSYMQDNRLDDAEDAWLRAGPEASGRLARLRAKREGFPKGLQHLLDAAMYEEVVEEWSSRGRPQTSAWISAAVSSFRSLGRATEGVDSLIATSAFSDATDLLLEIDPEMQVQAERYKSLIRAIAKSGEAEQLLQTIERLRVQIPAKEGSSSRIKPLHLFGVEQLVLAHHDAGWTSREGTWREAIRQLVSPSSGVLSWDVDETLRSIDLFILGAALELSEFWERAADLYERLFDSRDQFKRSESRTRWLYCQAMYEESLKQRISDGRRRGPIDRPETVQKRRISQAEKWRMPNDELQQAVRNPVPRITRRSQNSAARATGTFHSDSLRLDFALKNEGRTLAISLENQETFDIISINYLTESRMARFGNTSHPLADNQLVWRDEAWDPFWLQITHTNRITLKLGTGSNVIKEFLILDASPDGGSKAGPSGRKASPSSRTTASKQSIKGFDLANELGVSVQVLRSAFVLVGINPRKDGNTRLTAEEAERLRVHFKRR